MCVTTFVDGVATLVRTHFFVSTEINGLRAIISSRDHWAPLFWTLTSCVTLLPLDSYESLCSIPSIPFFLSKFRIILPFRPLFPEMHLAVARACMGLSRRNRRVWLLYSIRTSAKRETASCCSGPSRITMRSSPRPSVPHFPRPNSHSPAFFLHFLFSRNHSI